MNCKPGDLAVIVNTTLAASRPNIGLLVDVLAFSEATLEWRCRPIQGQRKPLNGMGLPTDTGHVLVYDRNLRPIRDPGDDAQDEMLRPLPIKEPA